MHMHSSERENYVRDFVMVEQGMLRHRLEAAIESMLALLDELDGDAADYEPDNDDEPWLSRREGVGSGDVHSPYDLELEHDEELTALESYGVGFEASGDDDAEDTHDAENDPGDWGIADMDGVMEQFPGGFYGVAL